MDDERKTEEYKPAPVEAKIPVRIVSEKGDVALIEWDAEGDVRRAYVPKSKAMATMTARELGKAQPYGEDWAEVFPYSFGRALSVTLHRTGIWTFVDVATHRAVVQGKIWAAMGIDALIRESRRS